LRKVIDSNAYAVRFKSPVVHLDGGNFRLSIVSIPPSGVWCQLPGWCKKFQVLKSYSCG